jgi:predicted  nucleic acid-binding Zn-ribbon protein
MKRIALFAIVSIAAFSLIFGCSKSSGDPGEAMVKHMTAMIKVIKDNKDDCDKIVAELEAYSSKHKEEIQQIVKAGKEMEGKMSDKEKEEYAAKLMKKMEPIIKDSMSIMMEVSQKCPEHSAKISAAMGDFK